MSGIRIEYFADLQESPAVSLVDDYKAEIRENGFAQSSGEVVVSSNPWTVAAMDGSRCVGFVLHAPYPAVNAIWIEAAYVHPDYRRKGIHSLMFGRVVEQARIEGVESVQGAAHIDNVASNASMKKQGRKVFGVMYCYEIESGDDDG